MKLFLIIPMGGKGQRFLNPDIKSTNHFKSFKKIRIIDGLINILITKTEIILIGNKRIKKNDLNLK